MYKRQERPCAYASKLLSEKQSRQSPGLRERAALIYALRHWKPYLIGKEFVLRTDHKPNVSIADSKTKLYDTLSDEIMQFQPFRMEYLRGDRMFVDALSRPPPSTVNTIYLKDICCELSRLSLTLLLLLAIHTRLRAYDATLGNTSYMERSLF